MDSGTVRALVVAAVVLGLGGGAGLGAGGAAPFSVSLPARVAADPVVAAAGDIACVPGQGPGQSTCRHSFTAPLLAGTDAVLPLGDLQYENGELANFTGPGSYHATWGAAYDRSYPAPGNHEYQDPAPGGPAAGYYAYWASRPVPNLSRGYYSFNLGAWHLISLNSEIAHDADSAQVRWLRDVDLPATNQPCILAYWHRARFSSGGVHGDGVGFKPFWDVLYAAKADVVLSAHDHNYERFAPQNPDGVADAQGIREFVVGTGGKDVRALRAPPPPYRETSEVRESDTYGVLKLTLHANSYDWQFVPEAGKTFSDMGSTACHAGPTVVRRSGCRAGYWAAGKSGRLRYICLRRSKP
jgi:calcineurin-like phosphoesterase family protein